MKGNKSVELKPNGENSLATLIGLAIPPTLPGELTFLFPAAPIDLFDLRSTKDGLFKPSFSSNRHVHLAHKTCTLSPHLTQMMIRRERNTLNKANLMLIYF